LMSWIVGDVPVVRLAGGIVHGGDRVCSCIGRAWQVGSYSGLNGESEICRVGERAANASGDNRGVSY
jgi:hypothetical protein